MLYLCILGLEFENYIVIIEVSTLKFYEKMKMLKFATRNALFGYFWVRILKKLLSYLKSAPSNLSNCETS